MYRGQNVRSSSFDTQRHSYGFGITGSGSSSGIHRGSMNNTNSYADRSGFSRSTSSSLLRPAPGGTIKRKPGAPANVSEEFTKKLGTSSEDFRQKVDERQKKPKIIFLDIDGVLHSIRVTRQEQLFNAQKMALLRKLVAGTDAQIVLSSAWRRTAATLRMAYQMLNRYGLDTPIDVTPDFGICGKRSSEILTWVEKYQIRDWVAIDDLDLHMGEPRMRGHFIKCNPLVGVTSDQIDQAIGILNGGGR